MFQWYAYCFKNFFNFNGRASRSEYWSFTLINIIVYTIFGFLSRWTDTPVPGDVNKVPFVPEDPDLAIIFGSLYFVFSLAIIIPTIAVTVRRLHDRDHSGLWVVAQFIPLLNLVVLIFVLLPSLPYPNKYGSRAPASPSDIVPPVAYNPYGYSPINQIPSSAQENVQEKAMTKVNVDPNQVATGSLMDEIMKEETPNADTQAGIEPVVSSKSDTHRAMGAKESSLVAKLKKLSGQNNQ